MIILGIAILRPQNRYRTAPPSDVCPHAAFVWCFISPLTFCISMCLHLIFLANSNGVLGLSALLWFWSMGHSMCLTCSILNLMWSHQQYSWLYRGLTLQIWINLSIYFLPLMTDFQGKHGAVPLWGVLIIILVVFWRFQVPFRFSDFGLNPKNI